ncbi:MAG: prepilin-type N-terminal cleavage/methylation domain-containing protein [Opitutae bacterium]|nr:prepilin-type N-terminal cleavage/methylation domain-containing protein [Opitutae bacterium]
MRTSPARNYPGRAGFTLVEVMISMTIVTLVLGLTMSTFLFGLRTMYKDTQRLITNASLRAFTSQITKETLDASTFYLFDYYTKLDTSVNLTTDPIFPVGPEIDSASDDYDKWIAHGDCLVLVTLTSLYRNTDIRQIRVYYRVTTNQSQVNAEAPVRYYETADTAGPGLGWGEGTAGAGNGHPFSGIATELNAINLNANPSRAGSRLLNARSKGRAVAAPYTPYAAGDLYPIFSTESPTANPADGFISINVEFINGTTVTNMLSSSSFNYTISPRK